MKANPTCRKCGVILNEENWYASRRKSNRCICKGCETEQTRLWRKRNPEKSVAYAVKWQKANPETTRANWIRARRRRGARPFNENRECSSFLGVHIAEQVLSQAFKDVKRMPMNNPGYDVICNRDKRIDIKSSCTDTKRLRWKFAIDRNHIADFFLCLAFDNREDLNPLHAWLIPGSKLNHLKVASISQGTIHKWGAYRLDTTKILACCDAMRTK